MPDLSLSQTWMQNDLPDPKGGELASSIAWQGYRAQFQTFSQQASRNRVAYQVTKVLTIVGSALITFLGVYQNKVIAASAIAAVILVAEALQQTFHWYDNWIAYRTAAEQMRQFAIDFQGSVDPNSADPRLKSLGEVRRQVAVADAAAWIHRMQTSAEIPKANSTDHKGDPTASASRPAQEE